MTQYSLKAKDLSTALELHAAPPKADGKNADEASSTSSLGELNTMLAKRQKSIGKENRDKLAASRATKSTAAMSYMPGQTIPQGGAFTSIAQSQADTEEMFGMPGQGQNVMNYPYMCDQGEELQFADKIKMMNSQ